MLEKIQFKILEYNRYLLNRLYDKGEKRLNKYGLSLEIALPACPPKRAYIIIRGHRMVS